MPPIIIVGLDGVPPPLLARLVDEGRMPTVARLMDAGASGVLESTPNFQSASAWTSLVTGANPGRHGILHFTNPTPNSYGFEQINAEARRLPSLWRLLSDAGRKVVAANVPVSFPAEPLGGAMIAGWLCPSPASDGFTYPPDLATDLRHRFGDYPIHPDVRRHALRGQYDRVVEIAIRGVRTKLAAAKWLIERAEPDVACVVVTETDSLQHWCWQLIDREHPEHDTAEAARWWPKIAGFYETLDSDVGELLEVAPDADVLVVSDHGQAANSGAQLLLRPWLIGAGYLVAERRQKPRFVRRALSGALELTKNVAPNRLKAWLRARLPGVVGRAQAASGVPADWSRTRAWTETGHIFVNTRGVWPEGIVEPGTERESLIEEISAGLHELTDVRTGQPLVAELTRGDAVFEGPHAGLMPDLLVRWRNDLRVQAARWRGISIRREAPPTLPTGAHHPDGTLIAAGPSFAQAGGNVRQSIMDVAPTVMHLCGLPIPAQMDGEVMVDLLAGHVTKDVRAGAVKSRCDVQGNSPSSHDAVVYERLRSLGYVE